LVSTQVINDVNRTLYKILRESFGEDDKDAQIIFGSPAEENLADNTKAGVYVFLYNVIEDQFYRNETDEIRAGANNNRLLSFRSPLAVNLYYMLTPFSASVEGKDTLDDVRSHSLIAKAMRAFFENGLIDPRYFPTDTVLGESQVRISPSHMNLEETTKIWTTFSKPFQLSVSYEVSTVWIHSEEKQQKELHLAEKHVLETVPAMDEKAMSELRTKGGSLIKFSPDLSGEITEVRPAAVQAGLSVSIYGRDFQGRKLNVKIDDNEIGADSIRVISENLIKIKIPPDLKPGVKKLSIKAESAGEEDAGKQQTEEELVATFQVLPIEATPIRITEIRPSQGKVGDIVTVYGINFTKDVKALIGNKDVLKMTFVDNSQINVMVPDGLLPGQTTILTVKKSDQDTDSKQFKVVSSS
jgi:hypothetical protein